MCIINVKYTPHEQLGANMAPLYHVTRVPGASSSSVQTRPLKFQRHVNSNVDCI